MLRSSNKQSVLYASSTDRVRYAARRMSTECGWKPVYWLATAHARPEIEGTFEGVLVHDYLQSVKGVGHPAFSGAAMGDADPQFLDAHASQIANALYMLERNDSFAQDMGLKERVEFVHRVVAYWRAVLARTATTIVVFEEEPHQASDYLLYIVARASAVSVVMPIRTMPDWGFLLSRGFEDGPVLHSRAMSLPDHVVRSLKALRGQYDEARKLMLWDQLDAFASPTVGQRVVTRLRKAATMAARSRAYIGNLSAFRSDQKEAGKPLFRSAMPYSAYLRHKAATLRKKARNRRDYDRLSTNPDLTRPYVYFALSYQPEKSTSPCGGPFVHQLLAIRTLAAALPTGWNLLVKEHPSQFVARYSRYGENFRSADYYASILEFPNTSLVPMSVGPYTLIDGARAVATVGGSACFEAAVRGRKSLLFGNTWYSQCPFVTSVQSSDDVRRALAGSEPSAEARNAQVDEYLAFVAGSVYRAPVGMSDTAIFDPDTARDEFYRAYHEYHERFLALPGEVVEGA